MNVNLDNMIVAAYVCIYIYIYILTRLGVSIVINDS